LRRLLNGVPFYLIWGFKGGEGKTPTAPLRGGGGWIVPFVATFQNLKQGSQKNKYTPRKCLTMRVRAYRFRAYSSNTTAGVLKTQLEVACKLYNTYTPNKKGMKGTSAR
jgi:hypothetical protein